MFILLQQVLMKSKIKVVDPMKCVDPDSGSSPQSEDKSAEQGDELTSIKEKPGTNKTTSNDKVVLLLAIT